MLFRRWYQQWDGTQQSLVEQHKLHKERLLSIKGSRRYILVPVLKTIEKTRSISYVAIHKNLEKTDLKMYLFSFF